MISSNIPIERTILDNGLRIVHSLDSTTAMAAVNILYDVGSRDEKRELTGMAHLFEHLMFGGSQNIADFDGVLTRAGGSSNAWTSTDFTNFYCTLPAQNADTAFYLESDRMLRLAFNPKSLDVQKGVVVEEFKQTCLDRPYGDLMHRLRRLLYSAEHPYSWPTIGLEPAHIQNVAMEDVEHWFYSHYSPANAILSVSGNIEFGKVVELAQKWFGSIPRREVAVRSLPAPGFPAATVREEVYGAVPVPLMAIAIPMDAYGSQGYFAADAITDLLSAGKAARLTREITYGSGRGLVSACDASIIGSEHEGFVLVVARLARNSKEAADDAEKMIFEEARKLAIASNISAHELERCFNNYEATFRFGNVGYLSRASNLAMAEYHGEDINRTISDRRTLTADIIAAEADKIFNHTPFARVTYLCS